MTDVEYRRNCPTCNKISDWKRFKNGIDKTPNIMIC